MKLRTYPAILALLGSLTACGVYDPNGGDASDLSSVEQTITNAPVVSSDGRHARANLSGAYCSAELITNEWFITAEHCFIDRNQDTDLKWGTGDHRYSANIYRHPTRDVALVKVSPPMTIDGSSSGFDMPLYPWTGAWLAGERPTAYGWAHVSEGVRQAPMTVTSGGPWGVGFGTSSPTDPITEDGDSGGGSFLSNYWGAPQMLAGVHSWGGPTFSVDEAFPLSIDWIFRNVYAGQALVCRGFVCASTLTPVPNYTRIATAFAPCSGAWDYEATYDTERTYDFVKLDGVAYTGQGSIRNSKPAGSSLQIELTTDYSVESAGLTLLRARCTSQTPSLGGRAVLRSNGTMVMLTRASGNYAVFGQRSSASGVGSANWSWASLGPQTFASQPVAITRLDGRLVIAARGTDDQIWARTETSAGSKSFSAWTAVRLAGEATPQFAGEPVLVREGSGRLVLLSLSVDGYIYRSYQSSPTGSWSSWGPLWTPAPLAFTSSPVLAINANGRFSLFTRGNDGALWHLPMWEDAMGEDWQSLGGSLPTGDVISAATSGDGRITVAVRDSAGGVSYRYQTSPSSSQWSFWTNLTGTQSVPFHPSATSNNDGRIALFASADNQLQTRAETAVGTGSFGNWAALASGSASAPFAIRDAGGIIHAFALDSSGFLHEVLQTSKNATTWSSWSAGKIGGTLAGL